MLVVLALILPLAIRGISSTPIVPDPASYTHIKQAEFIINGQIGFDSIRSEYFVPTPHTWLLVIFRTLGADWLLPPLLAGSLLVLLFVFLKRRLPQSIVFLSLISLSLAPTLIVAGTTHEPALLGFVLFMGAVVLRQRSLLGAMLLLSLMTITIPFVGLLAVLTLLVIEYRSRGSSALLYLLSPLIAGVYIFSWTEALPYLALDIPRLRLGMLFEFGNRQGVSIFFIFLGIYGLLSRRLPHRMRTTLLLIALAFLSILLPNSLLGLAIFLSVLTGFGIHRLLIRDWHLDLLRQICIILAICMGVFLLIVSAREQTVAQPNSEFREVMEFIGDQSREGHILTLPAYAPAAEYFSGRKAVLTARSRQAELEEAFYSRRASVLFDFLESSDARYVFINDDMRQDLFTRSDQGLLFVLPNTQRFVLIAHRNHSDAWYYIPRQ